MYMHLLTQHWHFDNDARCHLYQMMALGLVEVVTYSENAEFNYLILSLMQMPIFS